MAAGKSVITSRGVQHASGGGDRKNADTAVDRAQCCSIHDFVGSCTDTQTIALVTSVNEKAPGSASNHSPRTDYTLIMLVIGYMDSPVYDPSTPPPRTGALLQNHGRK